MTGDTRRASGAGRGVKKQPQRITPGKFVKVRGPEQLKKLLEKKQKEREATKAKK